MGRDGRRLLSGGRAVGSGGAEDVVVFGTELCRGAELAEMPGVRAAAFPT